MHGDQIDAERLLGQRARRRDLLGRAGPGVIAPQAMTPKPPPFEIAATRLRSDTQVIAPPMIASSQPRNSRAARATSRSSCGAPRRPRAAADDRRSRIERSAATAPTLIRLRRGRKRCAARASASSVYSSAISTLTLISEVEITWMLMPFSASALNIACATPAWLRMPTPITEIFTTFESGLSAVIARACRGSPPAPPRRGRDRPSADGEGHVGRCRPRTTFCTIMSTLIALSASGPKIAAATPGRSGTLMQRHLRFVAAVGDAADHFLFHDLILVDDQRSGRVGEARQHLHAHAMVHRHLDRAGLQHLGAQRRQFQHFLVGDLIELARLRNDARIGRVDAVDIGVDIAAVGLERRRQRHRRGIRAAAAQRRDAPVGPEPLEPGDHRDLPVRQAALESRRVSIARMRALPWTSSVRIGICQPSQERALMPSCSASASSPAVTC